MTQEKKTRGRKKTSGFYFTDQTQEAIINYRDSKDNDLRDKLYRTEIYPAFVKLSEILIRYKHFNNLDPNFKYLRDNLISFLTEKINWYNIEKGRAYSFFTVIGTNWLIQLTKDKKKKCNNSNIELDCIDPSDELVVITAEENEKEKLAFFDEFIEYLDSTLNKYFTQEDLLIADSLLTIVKTRFNFEKLNKRTVFFMVREMHGNHIRACDIAAIIQRFHILYRRAFAEYDRLGYITKDKLFPIW